MIDFKYILTVLSAFGLVATAPTPASAQPRVSFGLEIHIGHSPPPRNSLGAAALRDQGQSALFSTVNCARATAER